MGLDELFQTVEKETSDPVQTKVKGAIPEWINGSLYRVGPAKFEFGDTKCNHWFDGMAMVHRFELSKGHVTYRNRFIDSENHRKNIRAERFVSTEYGTMGFPDPCKTWYEKLFSYFKPASAEGQVMDNTNVNVYPVGEQLYAATETNYINRIDMDTLKTTGRVDLDNVVCVNGATAHPHIDTDGAIYNVGNKHGTPTIIKLTPPTKGEKGLVDKGEVIGSIPTRWRLYPGYMHSFGMSEHYIVIVEHPFYINVMKLLTMKMTSSAFGDCLQYYPNYPAHFHIIDRRTGERVNGDTDYWSEAFAIFHHINAYEENDQLVVDTVIYPNEVYGALKINKLQAVDADEYWDTIPAAKAVRFVLPLNLTNAATGQNLVTLKDTSSTAIMKMKGKKKEVHVTRDTLSDVYLEFPQINYSKYNSKKYNFVYAMGWKMNPSHSLVKIDLTTREMKIWREANAFPSEPVFISHPEATDEDDGVVLSQVLTTGPARSAYLLILDAKTMEEIGRAEAPVKISKDIHGCFVPANI